MDALALLPAFLAAVVLVSATPGPAMALVLRRAAVRGWRATVPTVLGLELGLFCWALAAGAGLAALIAASETGYTTLRVVGAVLLLTLGVRAWRSAWREGAPADAREPDPRAVPALAGGTDPMAGGPPVPPPPAGRAFGEGLLVQIANPKAAVFLFAFYPQFVPADGPVLAWTAALGLLQVSVETLLYLGLAVVVGRASRWFSRRAIRRCFDVASGAVFVGLGIRLAATSR